jgi:RNA-binding protein
MTSIKELKQKAMLLEPIINIGKAGLTDNVIEEIKVQLKKRKLIKVKFLKSALKDKDKKQLAQELVDKTDAQLIHKVGFVVVLNKK